MPTFVLDFDVYCAWCGEPLCNGCREISGNNGEKVLTIEPCKRCIDESYERGRDDASPESITSNLASILNKGEIKPTGSR